MNTSINRNKNLVVIFSIIIFILILFSLIYWWLKEKTPAPSSSQIETIDSYKNMVLNASRFIMPNLTENGVTRIELEDLPLNIKNLIFDDFYNLKIFKVKYEGEKSGFAIQGKKTGYDLREGYNNIKIRLKKLNWEFISGAINERAALIEVKKINWFIRFILSQKEHGSDIDLEIYALYK